MNMIQTNDHFFAIVKDFSIHSSSTSQQQNGRLSKRTTQSCLKLYTTEKILLVRNEFHDRNCFISALSLKLENYQDRQVAGYQLVDVDEHIEIINKIAENINIEFLKRKFENL